MDLITLMLKPSPSFPNSSPRQTSLSQTLLPGTCTIRTSFEDVETGDITTDRLFLRGIEFILCWPAAQATPAAHRTDRLEKYQMAVPLTCMGPRRRDEKQPRHGGLRWPCMYILLDAQQLQAALFGSVLVTPVSGPFPRVLHRPTYQIL